MNEGAPGDTGITITRAARRDRFTVVHNDTIEDDALSFRALGLLVYLLSKPDNWSTHVKHLATTHCEGREAVGAAIRHLVKAGYITRKWVRTDDQAVPTMHYLVSEVVTRPASPADPPAGRLPGQPDDFDHSESPARRLPGQAGNALPSFRAARKPAPSKEGSLVSTDLEVAALRPPPPSAPLRVQAEAIVQRWWDAQTPTPVESFIGVVKIVEKMLAAGWPAEDLAAALDSAPCVTVRTLLFELHTTGRQPRPSGVSADEALAWLEEKEAEDG